jgi:hypothetical protein
MNEEPLIDDEDAVDDAIDPMLKPLTKFLEAGFKDGQPIRRSWFYKALEIPEPTPGMNFQDAQKLQLRFVSLFERLRLRILQEANLALRSEHGSGCYSIVPASEQIGWAQARFDKDLSSTFKATSDRMTFLRVEELSPKERAEAVDAAASVASMKTHLNAARAAAKRRKIVHS